MDMSIIRDLFRNCLEAAQVLGIDNDLTKRVAATQAKLLPLQVGSRGQLQEWAADLQETDVHHRHTSHLFAVYPGRQISLNATPDLAKAAAISLEARGSDGDSRRSWTWPWRTALWARLGKPDKAGEMIRGLLTYNTMPNLFTTHPPFQIDGNLGITAGICETLVQSHAGEISILPAVPPAWNDGSIRGLKARGGFEIDLEWANAKVTRALVRSNRGGNLRIRTSQPVNLSVAQGGENPKTTPAEGSNPNPFFQIVAAGKPLVAAGATLPDLDVRSYHTVDVPTIAGAAYAISPASSP